MRRAQVNNTSATADVQPIAQLDQRRAEKRSGKSVTRRRRAALIILGVCVILGAVVLLNLQTPPDLTPPNSKQHTTERASARATPPARSNAEEPKVETRPEAPPATVPPPEETGTVTDADLDYIAGRNLLMPVQGVTASQLRDTFNQERSEGRHHGAIDIRAPQGTPVLAATEGVLIKLFQSDMGGITLYQLDPSGRYVYYYAHLMSYAEDMVEGKLLRRGDVIAYVGDTGNAGAGNYHLHFAISKRTSPHGWSGGIPINPYPFLVR